MTDDPDAGNIRSVRFADALGERYLSYALSTIMSRSLPDVRDGLKPVHRRLLFAMRELGLDPASGFKKCARVVGDVMGKYHPHGDSAIYDAMVRLAQEFAVRYPLVEGHGNFGNIDGDNAAAMRYTEARLTRVAESLLEGIDEDAVDFRETYDGEGREPVVLPSSFPNLLANGSQGIAVGMATNIPPHNAGEVCTALLYLLDHPNVSLAKLIDFMPGPDFPTGGVLCEPRENIVEIYGKGRGSMRLRARWQVEKQPRGNWQIVVDEIPYQVQKSRLVEKIAELLEAKKLGLLGDLLDESAADVRLVLVPKSRNIEPEALMEQLFRQTELETRFPLNMNVLDAGGVPQVMGLRDVLQAFLDHRQEVLVRRTDYRLARIAHRLEVLGGYIVAYLNLDEVIRIIREEDEPKAEMMRRWALTEVQANAILDMRLRALRKLEEIEIRKEFAKLEAEKAELEALLADGDLRRKAIAKQIRAVRDQFGDKVPEGRRRTEIAGAPAVVEIDLEALVEREPVTILCSEKGWIRAAKGHLPPEAEAKYKDGDAERFRIPAQTTDKLLIFTASGRFYTLSVDRLPGGRGTGEPLRLLLEFGADDDIVGMFVHRPGGRLVLASTDGRGFVVPEETVLAQTRNGRQVMNVAKGERAVICRPAAGDHVAIVGTNRRLLVFPLADLPEMVRGRGVILQRYRTGKMSDLVTFALADGLSWPSGGRVRRETDLGPWVAARGQAGRMAPHGFPRDSRFAGV